VLVGIVTEVYRHFGPRTVGTRSA